LAWTDTVSLFGLSLVMATVLVMMAVMRVGKMFVQMIPGLTLEIVGNRDLVNLMNLMNLS
jgi:hypothetical protein